MIHALANEKSELRDRILNELLNRDITVDASFPAANSVISFKRDDHLWILRSVEKPEHLFWYVDDVLVESSNPGKDLSCYLPSQLPQLAKELVDLFEKEYRHRLAHPTDLRKIIRPNESCSC
jgi:hypothetical protein